MNRKTIFKMVFLMGIGGVIGIILSLGLLKLHQPNYIRSFVQIGDFFVRNSFAFYIGLILCLFLPAVYQYVKAKRNYNQINISDDRADAYEKAGEDSFNLSMLINGVFLILNMMLFGMTFDKTRGDFLLVMFLFMFSVICASVLEIVAIRYIQKVDNRLKGEPTSLRFHKDFLESCDEAEKLRIYKCGYNAFQVSKNVSLGFIVITMISNITLETGTFPIFISCMIMLIQVTSYNYYSFRH
ncbi:DUF3169 family protein [Desulfosporosinus sp.]|uniref:DUF3169 family protein n=1 Tax=Desulfosporosinus sp. TaxID=157907 RepID=UPI0025C2C3E0|nr:DUF3169 family protein [Desulfosporosinus sp.]MBC2722853.1 DUF3169 family protein [Desulfosporosinus sp.]MBC2725680.1 DUF3169 family protein [Desulfosporosinus sp.]